MKKIALITIAFLLTLGLSAQNTFKYEVRVPSLRVGGTTKVKIDSIALVGGKLAFFVGADTSSLHINAADIVNLGDYAVLHSDTLLMLDPYFTESEIRKVDSDTVPLFIFGAGSGGAEADTALFTTSNIYGSFYNAGSDTLIITSLRAVMIAGSTPLGTDTLAIQVYWNDTINVTTGASVTVLNTNPLGINSTTVGTTDTSFNNATIPPNVWVFCKSPGVVTGRKPKALTVQLTGFKRNRSY